ncbi:MAG: methyltransferase domain-containing protein [Planctomycetales bacterium]|nr:methyltransferase domain-containing protein [Planctomycetales bacterium]
MDFTSISDLSLAECLELVETRFDAQSIATRRIDQEGVLEYFRQSDRGYRLFHSKDGAMHVALNCNEHFSTEGYLGQVELLEKQLVSCRAEKVLEVGCGTGFNTRHLAARLSGTNFIGLDLSSSHVDTARSEAYEYGNVEFETGDFQQLRFEEYTFDAVVAVECLCQTHDMRRTLQEAFRVLRPGGQLLVIDVFRQAPLESYHEEVQLAARLVEKAMAVDEFAVLDQWCEQARDIGFVVRQQTDLSQEISHNVARFHKLARRFFRIPQTARILLKAFPPRLLENAISGLLMPFTVGCGVQSYCFCVLERPEVERL